MGTHTYGLVIKRIVDKPSEDLFKEVVFSYQPGSTGSISELFESDFYDEEYETMDLYTDMHSCRELLAEALHSFLEDSQASGDNFVIGIRCMGEMYTETSKILEKMEAKKLERAIETAFGIEVKVKAVKQNLAHKSMMCYSSTGELRREYMDSNYNKQTAVKPVDRFIDLVFTTENNVEDSGDYVKISAILALLREKRILSLIQSRTKLPYEAIVKELFSISKDRTNLRDDSYLCWALAGPNDLEIMEILSQPFNDDGSDCYSVACLALYIIACNMGLLGDYDDYFVNGPVQAMEEAESPWKLYKKAYEIFDIDFMLGHRFYDGTVVCEDLMEYVRSGKRDV